MLEMKDFLHLPQVDGCFERLEADGPGLTLVVGLDPRPSTPASSGAGFLPSGRSTIFRILLRRMLEARPQARVVAVARSKEAIRLPRQLGRQITLLRAGSTEEYENAVADAAARRPDLLVVDLLDGQYAPAVLAAAGQGLRILSQMDTVFRGAAVARWLGDLGLSRRQLENLTWVLAVHRMPALCPNCRQMAPPDPDRMAELRGRYPGLATGTTVYYRAGGCAQCHHTGRHGDVALFDLFRCEPEAQTPLRMEEYALCLAQEGHLALEDVVRLEENLLGRTYHLLQANECALMEANAAMRRKLTELEAAHRVLQQRTEALHSLQQIGRTLIASTRLDYLASRLCNYATTLCGADRAVLYYLRPEGTAEVLGVKGWSGLQVHQPVDVGQVSDRSTEPSAFPDPPPGATTRHPDMEGAALRAGLQVPLWAQGRQVGLMMVHSTRKPRFEPGQVALLQAFGNQAALAIQRTGLTEQLEEKVTQLEAAQAELVTKERLERELELARQVQQSVLPASFPEIPGYSFAASYRPARQVGGDFYDVFRLDDRRFGVAIADVSDKGMPAALYMALTRSLLLAEARREASPRLVLSNVHHLLLELGNPDMYVTVFYGVVDGPSGQLTYARAGHDWPFLVRDGRARLLRGSGTVLGLAAVADLNLAEKQIRLAGGDRLVLYTDGLTDARSPNGDSFDRERLGGLLQTLAQREVDDLCAAVLAELELFQGTAEQFDDMALLLVGVSETGPAP